MSISIDERKHLTKSNIFFMVKTFNKLGMEGNFFNPIKGIYNKPKANIVLHDKRLNKGFPLKIKDRTKISALTIFFCLFFFFFFFWGLYLWHMEFPRLGVESELQPLPYATATLEPSWPMPLPQPHQNQAASATYTTAHGNAESLTH